MSQSVEALQAAKAKNFAGGSSFSNIGTSKTDPVKQETLKEKIARQRQERLQQSENDWKKLQEDKNQQSGPFLLGWMRNPTTQSKTDLWKGLFTSETTDKQKQFIKQCNPHLNEPVKEGEIVIIPTAEPTDRAEKQSLSYLQEDAKAASVELRKLSEDLAATVNRHLDVLDYYANKTFTTIKKDGLPSDYYAYASLGVGIATAGVEQHLNNINSVLFEINDLYASQVAMASRTGGINYGLFIAERAELFKKLDGSFSGLSSRSVKLPIYTQLKRNLKLSTKSVIHNASEILESGFVPNLGKRIANVSIGISAARGLGYVGLGLGVASGVNNIYEACNVNSSGECSKTASREIGGFLGGLYLGGQLSSWAAGGVVLVLGTASVPVMAIASISAFVIGGAVGGIIGSTSGKIGGDIMYEKVIDIRTWGEEKIEEWF
jgi:hypothetical protein